MGDEDVQKIGKALDRFDVALLNLLQKNNLATAEALAASVPLSPSAITRRLRRLREQELIAEEVAVLSPSLIERRLRAVVHVQLQEHSEKGRNERLRARLRDLPEVQICLEMAGAIDLLVVVVARDMQAFNLFADSVFESEPAIRRFETSFVKREIKNSRFVPLDDDDIAP
jgi:DNA-binding Lrp family transcriptional regulator